MDSNTQFIVGLVVTILLALAGIIVSIFFAARRKTVNNNVSRNILHKGDIVGGDKYVNQPTRRKKQ